jgi:hypothetical protein
MISVRNKLLMLLAFAAFSYIAQAQPQSQSAPILKQRLVTVAGELKIFQLDEGLLGNKFAIKLNNDSILVTDGDNESGRFSGFPFPEIIKHIKTTVGPFDEVAIIQQNMWGNACDGGPIWFLGLKKDGSFSISTPVDHCGGPSPVIHSNSNRITLVIPGHPPNRGKGYIPAETWIYENGEVKQVKSASARRKNVG